MSRLTDITKATTKDFSITITYDSQAQDIRNDTVTLYVKQNKDDTESLIEKNAVVSNGQDGVAVFALTSNDTDLAVGSYYYQIYWTLSNGKIFLVDEGAFNIKEEIK